MSFAIDGFLPEYNIQISPDAGIRNFTKENLIKHLCIIIITVEEKDKNNINKIGKIV